MLHKCSCCGEKVKEVYSGSIYQPFDDEPFDQYDDYCHSCATSRVFTCQNCGRDIFESNGLRKNIRVDVKIGNGEVMYGTCCVKCLQDEWLEHGMWEFKDGDWFNDRDLVDAGWDMVQTFFSQYKEGEKAFKEALDYAGKAIICLESSGMGLSHTFSLWVK